MFEREQMQICQKYSADYVPLDLTAKVGLARNVREGIRPLNGLRHTPIDGTTGWYIWAGEILSKDDDFFLPLHASHLPEWSPLVIPYLALPPGWRFLILENYEDVWFDRAILNP